MQSSSVALVKMMSTAHEGPSCANMCDRLLLMDDCRLGKCLEWSKMARKHPDPFYLPHFMHRYVFNVHAGAAV